MGTTTLWIYQILQLVQGIPYNVDSFLNLTFWLASVNRFGQLLVLPFLQPGGTALGGHGSEKNHEQTDLISFLSRFG